MSTVIEWPTGATKSATNQSLYEYVRSHSAEHSRRRCPARVASAIERPSRNPRSQSGPVRRFLSGPDLPPAAVWGLAAGLSRGLRDIHRSALPRGTVVGR